MRPSLLPGLIAAARRNADRGATTIRLFEIGRRYLAEGERATATVLLAGERAPRGWQDGKSRAFDAFDAKAEAIALLEAAGAPVANLMLFPDAGPTWHPGRSASLGLGPKTILARFGELHPRLAKAFDAPAGSVAAELFLDTIPSPRSRGRTSAAISSPDVTIQLTGLSLTATAGVVTPHSRARSAFTPPALQPITRDFAFLVPSTLTADALLRAIRGADKVAIVGARLFDRFESDAGLSLAVEVTLQPDAKSFTDGEIAAISTSVVIAAEKAGAKLRG